MISPICPRENRVLENGDETPPTSAKERNTLTAVKERPTRKPIDEILAYRNDSVLRRYEKDFQASPDQSERAFNSLKQFMIVCRMKEGLKVTSEPVDQFWHTFLLFTKDYRDFCDNYLGMFVNHRPFEDPAPGFYEETKEFAQSLFGELDSDYWPEHGKAECTSGCEE